VREIGRKIGVGDLAVVVKTEFVKPRHTHQLSAVQTDQFIAQMSRIIGTEGINRAIGPGKKADPSVPN